MRVAIRRHVRRAFGLNPNDVPCPEIVVASPIWVRVPRGDDHGLGGVELLKMGNQFGYGHVSPCSHTRRRMRLDGVIMVYSIQLVKLQFEIGDTHHRCAYGHP